MAEIEKSAILKILIEYAQYLNDGEIKSLTAERFLIAVCDFINGEFSVDDFGSKSKSMMRKLLNDSDISSIKSGLISKLNGDQCRCDNIVYINEIIAEAGEYALKKGLTELTPELLLQCILVSPNSVIGSCLKTNIAVENDFRNFSLDESMAEETINEPYVSKKEYNPKKQMAMITENAKVKQEQLLSEICGQDNAVSVFITGYVQGEFLSITDVNRVRPRATFLFAGPPGVGKTFLAEKAAEYLGLPFMRFDMSEYSDQEASIEFCGSDGVYKNAKGGNVTSFVEKNPKCVLLFDEIEKANISVIHLFLQMLDAGRLRDNHTDIEVSFKDAVIIFTTNAGKQLYDESGNGDFSGLSRKVILKSLENDINPSTGMPFFPSAICSRFASGNVVMFNRVSAYHLREIVKREVNRHITNLKNTVGIDIEVDELVYSAILFSDGGYADARTIRSRAETFFNDELFELFRLVASNKTEHNIEDIEKIKINVKLPASDKKILPFFKSREKPEALVFSSKKIAAECIKLSKSCCVSAAQNANTAAKHLYKKNIKVILIDIGYGINKSTADNLNAEDIESLARNFFWYVRENYRDIPVYILETPETQINSEEKTSFLRIGASGVVRLNGETTFDNQMKHICSCIHQQNSMMNLAKSNNVISFETSQIISDDGKNAKIELFDFEIKAAIDAEDRKNILSNVSKPDVRFDDIIGAEDAKKELKFFVDCLKDSKKYIKTGIKAPKGVILYGPPGTGKTMLAKAMACESDVTFITAEGNQFLQKFVGEGKDKVHELFKTARKYAPSILFIDEIDSIGKERRDNQYGDDILTAFLTEMDGFNSNEKNPVFVLAATNYNIESGGEKSLDKALMRRFDRKIFIDLPSKNEREKYLDVEIEKHNNIIISVNKRDNLADRSAGMSFAELAGVIELALRTSIREGKQLINDNMIEEAFETYNNGETKRLNATATERIARHEAGHAFLCWLSGTMPSYVTIVSRGKHGGYMQSVDTEGVITYTLEDLLSRIRISLGGRAAEIVYYGEKDGASTGASNDLENATALARQIICTYGMDEDFGLAVIDIKAVKSNGLSKEIRTAVNKILKEQMKAAVDLITKNKATMDLIVQELLSNNHLSGTEIIKICSGSCNLSVR